MRAFVVGQECARLLYTSASIMPDERYLFGDERRSVPLMVQGDLDGHDGSEGVILGVHPSLPFVAKGVTGVLLLVALSD